MDILNSKIFKDHSDENMSINDVKYLILEYSDELLETCSNDITKKWLHFINNDDHKMKRRKKEVFRKFSLPDHSYFTTKRLYVRSIDNENFYLTSPDYTEKVEIEVSEEFPFNNYSNRLDRFFDLNEKGLWVLNKTI
jgi:hypothetical protein